MSVDDKGTVANPCRDPVSYHGYVAEHQSSLVCTCGTLRGHNWTANEEQNGINDSIDQVSEGPVDEHDLLLEGKTIYDPQYQSDKEGATSYHSKEAHPTALSSASVDKSQANQDNDAKHDFQKLQNPWQGFQIFHIQNETST